MELRTCKICTKEKPLTDFYFYSASHKSRKSRCKKCESELAKSWYKENRENTLKQKIAYSKTYIKPLEVRYRSLLRNAIAKGFTNTITLEKYRCIVKKGECFYCPNGLLGNGYCIDRVDPHKGYQADNVVPCCANCNYMKQNLSYQDFINQVNNISRKRGKNESASAKTIRASIQLGNPRGIRQRMA